MLYPYEKLAEFYATDWGEFSLKYLDIIKEIENKIDFHLKTILDISCGTGNLIKELSKNYNVVVVGSDISKYMINKVKKNNPGTELYISDMADLKIDKKFDLKVL